MPTIDVNLQDLGALLGRKVDLDRLGVELELVKGELAGHDPLTGEIRVELKDTNRPDLWCTEGIARQIRARERGKLERDYGFYGAGEDAAGGREFHIERIPYRPFAAGFCVRGLEITDAGLRQLIQTQEKLTDNFGHRRRSVSVGIYAADRIQFPVHYRSAGRDELRFVPLGMEEELTLGEILQRHPKGIEYAHILEGQDRVPLLLDSAGVVLSFPPIINSRALGEVEPGDTHLFIEVTGTDLTSCLLVENIFAANLADRGATIEPVACVLAEGAGHPGERIVVPARWDTTVEVPLEVFRSVTGDTALEAGAVEAALRAYGVEAKARGKRIRAACPPWRNDYMHAVDVVEDCVISGGINEVPLELPRGFTHGAFAPDAVLGDRVRDVLLAFGWEELFSNVLLSRAEVRDRMGLAEEPLVEISNVMSETYSVLRDSLLPVLLRAEGASSMALYPHRIFEVGEVVIPDPEENHGSRTENHAAALLAHAGATFSEAHGYLDRLLWELGLEYSLVPIDHPTFIPGRCGEISVALEEGGAPRALGRIGEVAPAVLAAWGISVPCAAFELALAPLLGA